MRDDQFPVLNPDADFDLAGLIKRAWEYGLAPLEAACPGVALSLRYAQHDNFTGSAFYPSMLPALLHRHTAAMLQAARRQLLAAGADVVVWDAWRPPEAQVLLWSRVPDERYVAKPSSSRRWSWHCYGRAVDVGLVHAETGELLPMPSAFDDFTGAGSADYTGTDKVVAGNLRLLQEAMTGAGFRRLPEEWWHFSDPVEPAPPAPLWLEPAAGQG